MSKKNNKLTKKTKLEASTLIHIAALIILLIFIFYFIVNSYI